MRKRIRASCVVPRAIHGDARSGWPWHGAIRGEAWTLRPAPTATRAERLAAILITTLPPLHLWARQTSPALRARLPAPRQRARHPRVGRHSGRAWCEAASLLRARAVAPR